MNKVELKQPIMVGGCFGVIVPLVELKNIDSEAQKEKQLNQKS